MNDQVAEMRGIPTRQKLEEILATGGVLVVFNKKDGDERRMRCTTDRMLIPADKRPDLKVEVLKEIKDAAEQKEDKPNVTVWDLDANAWRSFIYTRVTHAAIDFESKEVTNVEYNETLTINGEAVIQTEDTE